MQEDHISQLLDDVKTIVVKNRAENYKQGKDFNVFYVQGIAEDEVKICRFLKEMLDPRGSHGQGAVFLRRFFCDVLKIKESDYTEDDYKNARISREERIDDSRRIDIVIRIKNRIYPFEVKVYAEDQDRQCFDYYTYIFKKDPETKMYYLTLDGHEPSKESRYTLEESQYQCIAFSDEILNWLDKCIGTPEIEQIYSLREILIQFRSVIRDLTGIQKGKLRMEIKEKIESSYDNYLAAIQIANTLPDVRTDKMNEVFEGIRIHLANLGYKEVLDSYQSETSKYYRGGKRAWPGLSYAIPVEDNSLKDKIVLRIAIDDRLYYGICPAVKGEKTSEIAKYIDEKLRPSFINSEVSKYFYWWSYFHADNIADYYHGNDDYQRLYDPKEFNDYMEQVYTTLNEVAPLIMGKR